MNGFLKKLRRDPGYFDRVYIPALPAAERGANPILEFAVFLALLLGAAGAISRRSTRPACGSFRCSTRRSAPSGCSRCAPGTFSPLTACFTRCSPPNPRGSPFDPLLSEAAEAMNVCLASPFHTGCEAL